MSYVYFADDVSAPPLPVPTRDQLCAVKESFQSLIFDTPSYGSVYWWETLAWWPDKADRYCAYAAKRAAGDTHAILDLSGCYREDIAGSYNWTGADWSQNLEGLVELAQEVIAEGFYIDLRLAGDGQSVKDASGNYVYNDPNGMTYGFQWLMDNLERILDAFLPVAPYIVWTPGYDGVFYGWEPDQCMAFAAKVRELYPEAVIALEFNTGHIPLGEGGGDYQPGGRMQDYDVIMGEFNPWNYHEDSTWQIVGRLVSPYHRPWDQPPHDDPNPPYYLAHPNSRGPWYFIAFEILTYEFVRGRVSPDDVAAYRAYFTGMGCDHLC